MQSAIVALKSVSPASEEAGDTPMLKVSISFLEFNYSLNSFL